MSELKVNKVTPRSGTTVTIGDSGEHLALAGNIGLGGATPTASGTGITFPATASPSSDANTLDDYEEGTWTPTLIGATTAGTYVYDATRTGGKYIKIGDTVFLTGVFRVNSITTAGTGAATIGGVPFTIGSNSGASNYARTGGVLLKQGGFSGSTSIFIAANPGTVLSMFQQDATSIADLAVTDVDDVFGIYSFQILIKI
jgi:hypothetical protein